MAYLTKDKVREIITNAPQGSNPQSIVSGLLERGHQLEGYPGHQPPESNFVQRFQEGRQRAISEGKELFEQGVGMAAQGFQEGAKGKTARGLLKGFGGTVKGTAGSLISGTIDAVAPVVTDLLKGTFERSVPDFAEPTIKKVGKASLEKLKEAQTVLKGNYDEFTTEEQKAAISTALDVANDVLNVAEPALVADAGFALGKGIAKTGPLLKQAGKEYAELGTRGAKATLETVKKAKEPLSKAAKFVTSESLDLAPEVVETLSKKPSFFTKAVKGEIGTQSSEAKIFDSFKSAEERYSSTGKLYDSVRKGERFTFNARPIKTTLANEGLEITEQGVKKVGKLGSKLTDNDMKSINKVYSLVEDFGDAATLTDDEILNLRFLIDDELNWNKFTSSNGERVIKNIRHFINETAKKNVPGLRELDAKYAPIWKDYQKIKKKFFERGEGGWVLKDNIESSINNLTNVANKKMLARVERFAPGISDEIGAIKALAEINKSNTFSSMKRNLKVVALAVGGGAVGGPLVGVGLALAGLAMNPKFTSKIIHAFGKFKVGADDLLAIEKKVQQMKKLNQAELLTLNKVVKELPEPAIKEIAEELAGRQVGAAFVKNLYKEIEKQPKQLGAGKTVDTHGDAILLPKASDEFIEKISSPKAKTRPPVLETPSVKDFEKYKGLASDLYFKNLDDMKLIRERGVEGKVIGVQNRAGKRKMFSDDVKTPKTFNDKDSSYKPFQNLDDTARPEVMKNIETEIVQELMEEKPPTWLPDELRDRELINSTVDSLISGEALKSTQNDLMDAIKKEATLRMEELTDFQTGEIAGAALDAFTDQFDKEDLRLFDQVRKLKESKFADLDFEAMRLSTNKAPKSGDTISDLTEKALERYRDITGIDDDIEAFEGLMSLPAFSERSILKKAQN